MATVLVHDWRKIKFKASQPTDFYPEVKRRVDAYFNERKLSRSGDWRLWVKSLALVLLDLIIYAAILSDAFGFLGVFTLYTLLGVTTCLICLNIFHDALHGAFFRSKKWNRALGYLFDVNGFSSEVWSISHNLEHHTYTNIAGVDHDIDKMILLRLAPTDGIFAFHRFQHWYALPLYMLTSLNWSLYSDYTCYYNAIKQKKVNIVDIALFILGKLAYLSIFIIIPMLVLSLPWWQILIGYLSMQFVGGLIAAVVFQLAHVIDGVEYPLPDEYGNMEDLWAIHEIKTTSNFGVDDIVLTHLIGGLNFQIEHHLFPHISHVHYPAISKIVRQTAKEYGLPYLCQPSFREALCSHLRTLKKLGEGFRTV